MMEPEDRAFLADLVANTAVNIQHKYTDGQEEHGGHLWVKPGMQRNAEHEAFDLVTYLFAGRRQLTTLRNLLESLRSDFSISRLDVAIKILEDYLGEPQD